MSRCFWLPLSGVKAFATQQKVRELKSRMAKLSVLKIKVPPTTIILQSPGNMNNVKSVKHGINANKIEQKSILSEKFKTLFNFHRIEWSKTSDRLNRYDQNNMLLKIENYVKI